MIACQSACAEHNRGLPEEETVELCVGTGHGRVLRIGDEDVWGREVNVASRLGEDTARSGEILVSEAMRTAVAAERPDLVFERLETARFPGSCWRFLPRGSGA